MICLVVKCRRCHAYFKYAEEMVGGSGYCPPCDHDAHRDIARPLGHIDMAKRKLERKATRYSGEVRIYCYLDENDNWVIRLNTRYGKRTIEINNDNWVADGNPVDNAVAWDEAARSALSFGCDDDIKDPKGNIGISEYAAYDEEGNFHIGRDFNKAYAKNKNIARR